MSLKARAWLALAILTVVMALLLYVPAGTMHYWQGWLYLAVFTGASVLTTLYLMARDPALLERRMRGGPTAEKRPAQRIIMLATSIGFVALLVVPALDRRFGWSHVPAGVVVIANALVAIGFALIARVYRENTYTSATIELAENQKVISTGPPAPTRVVARRPVVAVSLRRP